jgi:photosystem II PsbY protein
MLLHPSQADQTLGLCNCRLSILLTLFVPALGWVAFNIAGGLFGQLEKMKDRQVGPESRSLRVKRSVAGAMGLGAAGLLASAQTAEASELMQLAAGDNRWVQSGSVQNPY